MHIKEAVEADGVGMRWLRTAATTITATMAAGVAVWGAIVWLLEPRAQTWAENLVEVATTDLRSEFVKNAGHLDRLEDIVVQLEDNVTKLTEAVSMDRSPSWRFSGPETLIEDAPIGGAVTIRAFGYKLRECGVPVVDLYFINGGGVYHRFVTPTVLTQGGRGVAFPVDPGKLQGIVYRAWIPEDEGVQPGRASGYISVSYPESCPGVPPSIAGPLQFRILPKF